MINMICSPCHLQRDLVFVLSEKAKIRSYKTNLILFLKLNSVSCQKGFQAAQVDVLTAWEPQHLHTALGEKQHHPRKKTNNKSTLM